MPSSWPSPPNGPASRNRSRSSGDVRRGPASTTGTASPSTTGPSCPSRPRRAVRSRFCSTPPARRTKTSPRPAPRRRRCGFSRPPPPSHRRPAWSARRRSFRLDRRGTSPGRTSPTTAARCWRWRSTARSGRLSRRAASTHGSPSHRRRTGSRHWTGSRWLVREGSCMSLPRRRRRPCSTAATATPGRPSPPSTQTPHWPMPRRWCSSRDPTARNNRSSAATGSSARSNGRSTTRTRRRPTTRSPPPRRQGVCGSPAASWRVEASG